jgi:hypothetical protein
MKATEAKLLDFLKEVAPAHKPHLLRSCSGLVRQSLERHTASGAEA